jgi:hypothetical protein
MIIDALTAIRTTADVRRLFSILGYVSENFPFTGDAMIVARWKGFRIIAKETERAREGVQELTREIAKSSDRVLAVAIGPKRELAIAAPRIGQAGITKVLVVSLDNPSIFAVEQLERLRPKRKSTALTHALLVEEVLSSEAMGERFFTEFRIQLDRMTASIDRRRSAADRRMVALVNLSRILFLYFVQAKGWLDGRSDYLKHHLDRALSRKQSFHRSVLHPLFFGTLNLPPERRTKRTELGRIPYLNGGLFEPHPAERRLGKVHFPNRVWRDVFDELFERFRFTVRENDEVDAIAPDMLGRVFERLMNADERHDTGTFYTPESVVRQVVTATIEVALSKDLSPQIVRKLVVGMPVKIHEAHTAQPVLVRLRVLDPAVGSGAFLLGVLRILSRMRSALSPESGPKAQLRHQKEIMRDNLLGVDLNPVAVRLAELRLWLAVIAEDPTTDIKSVSPLPNLDGVVRQGDTLLDPLGAARSFTSNVSFSPNDAGESIRKARSSLFSVRGREHQLRIKQLRKFEMDVAHSMLDAALENARIATIDLTETAQSKDLFGKRLGLSKSQRQRLQTLFKLRQQLQKALRKLADGSLPFFSFEVHTPDILSSGGFDVVVGNPPWVRAEQIPRHMRFALKARFRWWKTSGQRGYAHQPDLAVAFLERSLELTRNGGAVGLLLPSKITSAGYGEAARRGLVSETSIEYVHRVSDREASRFGATTYPLALVARKEKASQKHSVRLDFDASTTLTQSSLDNSGPWVLLASKARKALEEFRSSGKPLGQSSPPMLGVKTGADSIFVGRIVGTSADLAIVALQGREVLLEPTLLRPVLRGRDVRRFSTKSSGVILWCHGDDGTPFSSLPSNAASYFGRCAREARNRSDYRSGPVWTLFRTRCTAVQHRIVWSDIVQRPRAVVLEETAEPLAIPLNTCYVASAPNREAALAATAVFNSTWAAAFFVSSADEARGGYRRINGRVARLLPVPKPGPRRAALAQLSKRVHENEGDDNEDVDAAVAYALDLSTRTQDILRSQLDNPG